MPASGSVFTRRHFLEAIGATTGGVAVHEAMRGLGLAAADTPPPPVTGRAPRGARVVVIGAGLAGLAAALELESLGYTCEVLDARPRVGGRCFTVRGGTRSEEPQLAGLTAAFDEGHYLNAGPARIPHHHATTLEYCRTLGVAIEAFCGTNEAAWVHDAASGRRMRLRELRADWRGHTAELLAKAAASDALDVPLSAADRDRLVEWLRREGALTPDLRYAGTPRRGYAFAPGEGDAAGTVAAPASLDALLGAGFAAYLNTEVVLQTPMFQVVGGMDRLAAALAARVQRVTLGARVTAIEQPGRRVRVRCEVDGEPRQLETDYAVCALPLTELRELALDVSPVMEQAIGAIGYSAAGKIGVQFKRRFWEEDEGIYGGISRTSLDITQMLYPSTGYLSPKGVVVGYYQNGEKARAMGALPHARRLEQAVAQGEQVHPQYRAELESSFSIAWEHVRFNRGGWAQFTEAQRQAEYVTLQQPDGGVYLAGDHLSYLSGWMAGALGSGRAVARRIHERASRELPSAVTAMARR